MEERGDIQRLLHSHLSQLDLDQEILAEHIIRKLKHYADTPYGEMARLAFQNGLKTIGATLLEREVETRVQVGVLIEFDENVSALGKAVDSGDPDLINLIILHLHKKLTLEDIKMTICDFPSVQSSYVKYCKHHNKQTLYSIYLKEDNFGALGEIFIAETLDETKSYMRDSLLRSALDVYLQEKNDFYASTCYGHAKLLEFQKAMDEKSNDGEKFVGKSIHDTCLSLLLKNETELAERLRTEYSIPERRFWWLKIQSLSCLKKWSELEEFSATRKSPIGYAPFADVCLQMGNKKEALKYLSKMDVDSRIKCYIKAGFLNDAGKLALRSKSRDGLFEVRRRCVYQSDLFKKVDHALMKMTKYNRQIWHRFSFESMRKQKSNLKT
jgi:hypothetical protein